MSYQKYALGIDIGSVTVKVVLLNSGSLVSKVYRRFSGKPFETLLDILRTDFSGLNNNQIYLGSTGIGGKTLRSILGGNSFGEISAISAGNFSLYPEINSVIEMGGEDSKFILLNQASKTVADFAMNAQCAAGTGSFLDQQAGRLKIDIEKEFGQMALKSKNPPRIAGRCSVFAKSDMIHLQQIATPDYDIVAGLCFAVARNFKSSIARGKEFVPPVAFEGGVAANPGMVRAFKEILDLNDDQIIIPEHYNVIGAYGSALMAYDKEPVEIDFDKIEHYLSYRSVVESGRSALEYNFPDTKSYDITSAQPPSDYDNLEVFLGVDIGSLSTNLVLIDNNSNVIARRYLMTEGRPIEAVRKGLQEIEEEVGNKVIVKSVGTTGSGRYLIGDLIGADIVRNEITAQATAAVSIDPTVDTIFEIGGQDSKYISIDKKAVIDFEMNKACAAGTGSFLQEQADKLNINIEKEFADHALDAKCPVGCGERCTVFMESDLVAHQRTGAKKEDLLAGLAYSIASNYLTKVVGDRKIGQRIFFQGGVAWNKAVVAAFESLTGKEVIVPPHHDVTGAIGAAMLAREQYDLEPTETKFKGFDFYKRRYDIETFPCTDCSNQCEIHQVNIEGEAPLYYGARCEKYEVSAEKKELPPNYIQKRQQLLHKRYLKFDHKEIRGRVAIPRVLHFFEYYPFWKAFFESNGFKVVDSDLSDHTIVEDALKLFSAETCFPIKIVYGHIANLVKKKPNYIFLPSVIKVAADNELIKDGSFICPYVQTINSAIKARFDFEKDQIKFVTTPISLTNDIKELQTALKLLARDFDLSNKEYRSGVEAGLSAYRKFKAALKEEGNKILAELKPDDKLLVVVSRPYNGYDRRLSLEIPDKVRNLGYKAVPVDFFDVDPLEEGFPYMYWKYGRKILSSGEYIRNHPNMYAIFITSFGCGPDSFINHFFRREMAGKPYLMLELDEHSADAGAITRAEAFIDSLRYYKHKPSVKKFHIADDQFKPFEKTIYIPNMCDHAYPLRASFERFGLTAEVLDEPDNTTLDFGKKFTTGKECYPCVLTTGDMIKKIKGENFNEEKSVFFMPGATGPCRFGLYNQFHRMVLDDLGYNHIPIFSPNSKDGYSEFGLDGTDFRKTAWRGMVFVDGLIKLLLRTRPYETDPGVAEKLYYYFLAKLDHAIVHDESLEDLALEASEKFAEITIDKDPLPLVGLVGEIYLRNNRFSNNHLITKLESYGLEVWLASFTEWPLYTSQTFKRDSIRALEIKGILKSSLQILVQEYQEHSLLKKFNHHNRLRHDYQVGKVMKLAEQYLPLDYKGEAILSIGKAIEMHQQGATGIVNAMPFNCMPGTVVSSLSKKISEDLDNIPWLNISYEGLRDSGEDTRLEAFADQVKSKKRSVDISR